MCRSPIQRSTGNAKVIAIAAAAALGLGAKAAWNAYESGARDPGYIIFISLAVVVAIAMVAPGKLLRPRVEEEDWDGNANPHVSVPPGMAIPSCVKLDVFGKRMLVEWHEGAWRTYLLGSDGKRSLVNIPVPATVSETELVQYFDDIYHEAATPRRPAVVRLP